MKPPTGGRWAGSTLRKSTSRRAVGGQEAFTLIELMMVVLIIAILIAIAIPTFLGARQRASNRASQSSLRLALTAETTYYADYQEFTDVAAVLRAEELGLNWMGNAPSGDFKSVSTVIPAPPANREYVCLAVLSQTGQTYGMVYVVGGAASGTYYGTGTGPDAAAFCAAPPAVPGNWSTDVQQGWRN
ncbi:MAG: hypothetical protein DCC49_06060 [Acidobacteria bacterium]|nr:MAG: hypothetical protein DCC49_06060 [Acidobacteriota bacterium]